MITRFTALPAALMLLSGCTATLRGTPPILDSAGVYPPSASAGRTHGPSDQNLSFREQFRADAVAARNDRTDPARAAAMMRSGQLLIRLNCAEFFQNAEILQRDADIGRDMITPIITILTGIVSLRNLDQRSSDRLLQGFNLASSSALAGISIIDKNFLFGSDNVHEVRELIFDALAAGERGNLELGTGTFEDAVSQLVDQQVICAPANILMRTRQAIAAGRVSPDTNGERSSDDPALIELGDALGLVGSATSAQAVALWALYKTGSATVPPGVIDQLNQVRLGSLISTGPSVALSDIGTSNRTAIITALNHFSNENKDSLEIAANRVIHPPPSPPPGAPAIAGTRGPVDALLPGAPGRRRVRLIVQ